MNQFVKICGLREQKHIEAALEGGANAIGFVAYPPSPRFVTPSQEKNSVVLYPMMFYES